MLSLFPEHACALVQLAGDFRVPSGAEEGAGTGIGVEQREFLNSEHESSLRILKLLRPVQEEGELSLWRWAILSR